MVSFFVMLIGSVLIGMMFDVLLSSASMRILKVEMGRNLGNDEVVEVVEVVEIVEIVEEVLKVVRNGIVIVFVSIGVDSLV